uniref:NYN domain-containing protein n=1 Tax=Romanomermis culicivorax TaxID=13658 RepID=A0A915KC64_ROMCU
MTTQTIISHRSSSSPNVINSNAAVEQLSLSRPIGIYWDIQNCQIPVNRNPLHIVQRIREKLYKFGGKEAEFICVCDVQKEKSFIIDRLNAAQKPKYSKQFSMNFGKRRLGYT